LPRNLPVETRIAGFQQSRILEHLADLFARDDDQMLLFEQILDPLESVLRMSLAVRADQLIDVSGQRRPS
jgi:hypothetical protein